LFLLRWEWFRIYFESGVVKLASHDYSWRHLSAMDDYYQNGPLPTWIGWYVQQLPHPFHAATAFMTLAAELGLVFMLFLPRPFKIICFFILTPFQIVIILTANYTFLNYLVLMLGFLLLDDGFIRSILPRRWQNPEPAAIASDVYQEPRSIEVLASRIEKALHPVRRLIAAVSLGWVFYATTALLLATLSLTNWLESRPTARKLLWDWPVVTLEPFRIANSYGLFAVMTHERYEIEFQGSQDGQTWVEYPFRYKPQDIKKAPGIYAPYQPRFEWNLWFASLGGWRQNMFVLKTQERLLRGDPGVLALFAKNPFPGGPPRQVRSVLWQYWFTDIPTKRKTGAWWRRELQGLYAPVLERLPDGRVGVADSGSGLIQANPPDRR
jgi:hypothetical protein